jgi:hypothetical protein
VGPTSLKIPTSFMPSARATARMCFVVPLRVTPSKMGPAVRRAATVGAFRSRTTQRYLEAVRSLDCSPSHALAGIYADGDD